MARYKGRQGAIEVGDPAVEMGEVESFDIELSLNEIAANVMGKEWEEIEDGLKAASGQISVLSDPNDPGQQTLTLGSRVQCVFYPEGNTTGLSQIAGEFLVTNVGKSSNVGDMVKTSYSVRNSGQVTLGTVA